MLTGGSVVCKEPLLQSCSAVAPAIGPDSEATCWAYAPNLSGKCSVDGELSALKGCVSIDLFVDSPTQR